MYRRSLSSGPNALKNRNFPTCRDPQGLRRPRFSFFIFTCQTARNPKVSPAPCGAKISGVSLLKRTPQPHPTPNDNRQLSAVFSLTWERSLTGTEACLGCGPRRRRAQWSGYRPCRPSLSTPMSRNRRIAPKNFSEPRNPDLSGLRAVLEPHSCDVLHIKYATAGRIQV